MLDPIAWEIRFQRDRAGADARRWISIVPRPSWTLHTPIVAYRAHPGGDPACERCEICDPAATLAALYALPDDCGINAFWDAL